MLPTVRLVLEQLTREIARIDELGGMVAAIDKGHPQRAIAERAWQ